jgi:hypothetical protein
MGTPAMYTDTILAALESVIHAAIPSIITFDEAFPEEWPSDALLPAVFFDAVDFVDHPDTANEKRFTQTYEIHIYLVALKDATHSITTGRQLAESIRNTLKANRSLGLGENYYSLPGRVTKENVLESFFVQEKIPRLARMIRLIVTKDEDES